MFNEKIIARNREVGNHLCVGIDPSGHDLSPFFEAELFLVRLRARRRLNSKVHFTKLMELWACVLWNC